MRNNIIFLSLSFIIESISAPDPARISLEAESAKWFGRSLISGFVVAFGCLLEIWETAVSVKKWVLARRGLPVDENPTSWGIPIAAIGLLLVVGGIVAEVAYEGLASNADARLRAHESDVLSAAEANTALADSKAGEAIKQALESEAGNIKLQTDLKNATAQDTRRQTELEVEQRKTAAAQEDAAKAQLALKEYVESVALQGATREIDGPKFAAYLKQSTRKGSVQILYNPDDSEALSFASQIKEWMGTGRNGKGAGWDVSDPRPIPLESDLPPGTPADAQYMGLSASTGLTLIVSQFTMEDGSPQMALTWALSAITQGVPATSPQRPGSPPPMTKPAFVYNFDPSLPRDSMVLVIGKKK